MIRLHTYILNPKTKHTTGQVQTGNKISPRRNTINPTRYKDTIEITKNVLNAKFLPQNTSDPNRSPPTIYLLHLFKMIDNHDK